MPVNISNRLIGSIEIKDKPYEIRDSQLKGLILRIQPSGVLNYYLQYERSKRIKLGDGAAITPMQARELAKNILSEVYQGDDPAKKRKQEAAENYLAFIENTYAPHIAKMRSGQEKLACLKRAFPELHKLQISEITPMVVEKWRQRRLKEGLKPASINRQLADLKSCLNFVVKKLKMLKEHPLKDVESEKLDSRPNIRYLDESEEASLRKALDDRESQLIAKRHKANEWRAKRDYPLYNDLSNLHFCDYLKPCVILSLNTGLRRGELFNLKWNNIDLKRRNLTVDGETSKSGSTRHIPLNDEALLLLKQWKEQGGLKSMYVFPNEDGQPFHDIRTAWGNVLKKAEIHNFRWHDLRHSFASKLIMNSVEINTVRELLGHSDYKMTLRYAHLAPEHKAAAVAKLVAVN